MLPTFPSAKAATTQPVATIIPAAALWLLGIRCGFAQGATLTHRGVF
jgi:hypothetical protein